MADTHNKKVRSYNMSRIKAKNTLPELLVRRFLFSKGYRYSIHNSSLPGKPDLVLQKHKIIIFVNGCFWHQHPKCRRSVHPKSNQAYWIPKIRKNVARDKKNLRELKKLGWKVITIWECELKPNRIHKSLKQLVARIQRQTEKMLNLKNR